MQGSIFIQYLRNKKVVEIIFRFYTDESEKKEFVHQDIIHVRTTLC